MYFVVLDPMSCKQIHVKTIGKQRHETYWLNYIMQIAMFRLTTALRSAGNNKLHALKPMFSALQAHVSNFFFIYIWHVSIRIDTSSGVYKNLKKQVYSVILFQTRAC